VLWRGLDINYTGGVLEHPARVAALHAPGSARWSQPSPYCLHAWLGYPQCADHACPAAAVDGPSVRSPLQLLVAVFMILKAFPLSLAAGHNAGAALLLMSLLLLNRRLREA
jgi:cytochrome c oxidase assembly protein subunit 15